MEYSGSPPEHVIRLGPDTPQSPVIVSVPHAGRYYPESLLESARLDETSLRSLEDRHVDSLVAPLANKGYTIVIGQVARAWIDFNRSEREIDPAMVYPPPKQFGFELTAKVRGGLGLVPRRLARHGNIYRHAITQSDLSDRIRSAHRPYHGEISDLLDAARQRFGIAVLLDCHSMPPLRARDGQAPAEIIIGDRHGKSSAPTFAARAVDICRDLGFRTALNTPYAGGHILNRHARPERDIHGLQLEICRSIYLDRAHDQPGPALQRVTAMVAAIADGLASEALSPPNALAAE
jgi:N-formylglutamate amidohydrolase